MIKGHSERGQTSGLEISKISVQCRRADSAGRDPPQLLPPRARDCLRPPPSPPPPALQPPRPRRPFPPLAPLYRVPQPGPQAAERQPFPHRGGEGGRGGGRHGDAEKQALNCRDDQVLCAREILRQNVVRSIVLLQSSHLFFTGHLDCFNESITL